MDSIMAVPTFPHSSHIVKSLALATALLTTCFTAADADDFDPYLMAATRYCLNDQLRNVRSPGDADYADWLKFRDAVFDLCDVRNDERDAAKAYAAHITEAKTHGLTIIELPPAARTAAFTPAFGTFTPRIGPPETSLCVAPSQMTRDGCQPRGYRPKHF
jgi:hypothetical protein